jgi:1,4-alpha-glucan branching enzyme
MVNEVPLVWKPSIPYIPLRLLKQQDGIHYMHWHAQQWFSIIEHLEQSPSPCHIVVLNPLFLSLFESKEFQERMTHILNEYAKDERKREWLYIWLKYDQSITKIIQSYQRKNQLILIPTIVSDFPLPLLRTHYGLTLQVDMTISIWQQYVKEQPAWLWLPSMAYVPGLERYLLQKGIRGTFLMEVPGQKQGRITPYGWVVIPVGKKGEDIANERKVKRYTVKGDWSVLQNETSSLTYSNEQSWQHIVHFPFTYEQMEQERSIVEEHVLSKLKTAHRMEHILSLLQNSGHSMVDRVRKQLQKEWMMYLHLLALKEPPAYVEPLIRQFEDSFLQLKDQLENQHINSHFLKYREGLFAFGKEQPRKNNRRGRKELKTNHPFSVLMLSWEFPPNTIGGLARHVYDLSQSLVKKGIRVHVVTANKHSLPAEELVNGVHVHRVIPLHVVEADFKKWVGMLNQALVIKATSILQKEKIDVIHAHDWMVGTAAQVLKNKFSLPLLSTIHSTEFGRNQGIYTSLQSFIHQAEEELIQASHHLIVCSEFMKDEVQQIFSLQEKEVSVVPNGVYVDELQAAFRIEQLEKFSLVPKGKKIISSFGRMVKEKGFDTLIEAAQKLIADRLDIVFVIGGTGPLLEIYRQMVREKGIAEHVHFVGYINELERNALLASSYASVFPSTYEPFGIVAIEAMAAQVPIIVSKTGGFKGIVQEGVSGLFMEPNHPESLVNCLQRLLTNDRLAHKLALNGKEVASHLYRWDRIAEETVRIMKDIQMEAQLNEGTGQ